MDKTNGTKVSSFFFCELQHSFTFNLQFLYELKHKVKLCVEVSIFDSILFLLKFLFFFNKMHGFFWL